MKKTTEDQLYAMGWSILALAIFTVVLLKMLHLSLADLLPGCILYRFTGWYCPGCGGTRALSALLSGHPVQSFLYHPVVDYVGILCGWFMLSQTVERLSHGRIRIGMKYHDHYLWILLAILVLYCVILNVLKLLWGIEIPLS